jgi:hypothetical protein
LRVEAEVGLSIKTKFEDETMLSSARSIPLLIALTSVVLSGCDGPETAPTAVPPLSTGVSASAGGTERFVDEAVYDLTGSLTAIECANGQLSELVELEGQIFERFAVVSNPAGGFRATYHTMPIGLRGIGTETGEEYRVTERDNGSFGETTTGLVGSYRQVIRLRGQSSHRVFQLIVQGHYRLNANGEIKVEREKIAASCET